MSADVQILRGDSGDCTVTVPKTFVAKTGKPLLPEIFVGRALGKGLQVRIMFRTLCAFQKHLWTCC